MVFSPLLMPPKANIVYNSILIIGSEFDFLGLVKHNRSVFGVPQGIAYFYIGCGPLFCASAVSRYMVLQN